MSRATNTDGRGAYCGRAANGVSALSMEDLRQVEAHRSKERPTPWSHLARRFGCNEVDLRMMYEGKIEPAKPATTIRQPVEAITLKERLRMMWTRGDAVRNICEDLGLSERRFRTMQRDMGLPPRRPRDLRDGDWTPVEDDFLIYRLTILKQSYSEVADALPGRTIHAVKGRAERLGVIG